jgi:hypothetical protein
MPTDEREARTELAAVARLVADRLESDEPLADIVPSLEGLQGAFRELVSAVPKVSP